MNNSTKTAAAEEDTAVADAKTTDATKVDTTAAYAPTDAEEAVETESEA